MQLVRMFTVLFRKYVCRPYPKPVESSPHSRILLLQDLYLILSFRLRLGVRSFDLISLIIFGEEDKL